MSKTLSKILHDWLKDDVFTVHEMADACGVSTHTIYKYAGGDRNIPFERAKLIHKNLAAPGGRHDIPKSLLTPAWELCPRGAAAADGAIDDEMADMMEALGQVVTHYRAGARGACSEAIGRADLILHRAKAERDRL